ncbi:hypothetical protein RQP46_009267 [Phenoliferia psychrophenolica]
MLQDANRPRPLSSQPSRKWGDEKKEAPKEEKAPSSNDIEWALGTQDWPPSPPPKPKAKAQPLARKVDSFSGSVSSHSASTSGARAGSSHSSSTNNTTRPPVAASSSRAPPSRPVAPAPARSVAPPPRQQLAPMFRSANSRPTASTSTSSNSTSSNSLNSASTSAGLPKKRPQPWDNLDLGVSSRQSKPIKSSFHTVGGTMRDRDDSASSSKARLLTSDSMNIKQKVVLSPEQQMVLKLVVDDGKNVFFTGSAGTGKSVLLREIITSLKNKYKGRADACAVTASTGMAACNIGGLTIHSFSGVGLGKEPADVLIAQVRKNRKSSGRWARTQVLVVDEISMIDGILFDKIAAIASAIKKKPGSPFGGIQASPLLFDRLNTKSWKDTISHTVNLTQVFRQKSTEFIDMLNEMRFGQLSASSIAKFKSLSREMPDGDGTEPTELFPRREDVERSNQARLNALPGEATTYKAEDWTEGPSYGNPNAYLSNFMAPEKLVLKIGAQVMLIKNLDPVLVNGTIGIVTGFGSSDFDEDDDPDDDNFIKREGEREKKKLKMAAAVGAGTAELAPIIEWRIPGGTEKRPAVREEFKVENQKGEKQASRKQYPIILAWAMSIHKSQGQTLPRIKVDLRKVFEKGQSYVALSRAVSLDGLQVIGFDAKKVEAHPKVIAWSKTLTVLS